MFNTFNALWVVGRMLIFLTGTLIVVVTVMSSVRTFVLPRAGVDPIARTVFLSVRSLINWRIQALQTYEDRDRVMAFYAPASLLALLPAWLALVMLGYTLMFWAVEPNSIYEAFRYSGSSLLTLGFAYREGVANTLLAFSEATIGLILVALLIAYLPTMYAAFSRRETAVTLLEVRAGDPPWAIVLIERYHRLGRLKELHNLWEAWELWFAEIEESHTSLAALVFFRSQHSDHSWVTAAGAILDAASFVNAALDMPHDSQADLCIRAGYIALRHVAGSFRISFNRNPHYPADPISVTRDEFELAYDRLLQQGVPMKPDRDQAWQDFAGWRVNYDRVLLALCSITMAPSAPWSSDRAPRFQLPPLIQTAD